MPRRQSLFLAGAHWAHLRRSDAAALPPPSWDTGLIPRSLAIGALRHAQLASSGQDLAELGKGSLALVLSSASQPTICFKVQRRSELSRHECIAHSAVAQDNPLTHHIVPLNACLTVCELEVVRGVYVRKLITIMVLKRFTTVR